MRFLIGNSEPDRIDLVSLRLEEHLGVAAGLSINPLSQEPPKWNYNKYCSYLYKYSTNEKAFESNSRSLVEVRVVEREERQER